MGLGSVSPVFLHRYHPYGIQKMHIIEQGSLQLRRSGISVEMHIIEQANPVGVISIQPSSYCVGMVSRIKYVSFIVRDIKAFEDFKVFLSKRFPRMVFLLVLDVFDNIL